MNIVLNTSFSKLKKREVEITITTKQNLLGWLEMPISTFLFIFPGESKNIATGLITALKSRGIKNVGDIFFYTKSMLENNEDISIGRLRQMRQSAHFGYQKANEVIERRKKCGRLHPSINGKRLKHLENSLAVLGLTLD
jgi:hypothetical protein